MNKQKKKTPTPSRMALRMRTYVLMMVVEPLRFVRVCEVSFTICFVSSFALDLYIVGHGKVSFAIFFDFFLNNHTRI